MCVCVRVGRLVGGCVCVFVYSKKKNMSDQWLALPSILKVSNGRHMAKEKATREMGPFHQSITDFLNLHVLGSIS